MARARRGRPDATEGRGIPGKARPGGGSPRQAKKTAVAPRAALRLDLRDQASRRAAAAASVQEPIGWPRARAGVGHSPRTQLLERVVVRQRRDTAIEADVTSGWCPGAAA